MRIARKLRRCLWQPFLRFLETGFEVMARYPHDLTELTWARQLLRLAARTHGVVAAYRRPDRYSPPPDGRPIKIVPPPASQRYQSARPSATRPPFKAQQPV